MSEDIETLWDPCELCGEPMVDRSEQTDDGHEICTRCFCERGHGDLHPSEQDEP